ncbi:phosphatase PAP2 family protein [Azohydromonas caseinilytica]|uniref:Phosphatase PAP2 family protein n=1 Tax=Azohydromonas caseinilytica TaxID=2728836 RepID=A0A848FCR6_9BURK|nr:phosphatase PAP2 family protein [Azohydromonas caseinilytica]NML16575.1 phosphatase PAP2 family protein [Azohydromonas caseinilytica]
MLAHPPAKRRKFVNQALFFALNDLRSPFIDAAMNLGTRLGDFWNMPWIAALLLVLLGASRRQAWSARPALPPRERLLQLLWTLLASYVVAGLVVSALKFGLQWPRPAALFGPGVVHAVHAQDSPFSFPSGHSAFAMLVAALFWPCAGWYARVLLVFYVLWVGISRVNLGMHFPGDVICGWAVGAAAVWAARRLPGIRRRAFVTTKTKS